MKRLVGSLLLAVVALVAGAQDFSNKGTEFWVAYGYHQVMTTGNAQEMVLYFAAEEATTVTVSIPGNGYSVTYNVPANSVYTSLPLPKTGPFDARLLAESTAPENKGIRITSTKPIVAYAHIYNQSVSGATILFPTNTLGREYYSINYTNRANYPNSYSWAYVVATDTGTTTVEIVPSQPTLTRAAGVPFTVTLTQGQVFNLMGQFINATSGNNHFGVDLTGTTFRSINTGTGCKKIAVFSGSGRISITCPNNNSASSDNYMVQSFPKNAWGKRYLTATAAGGQDFNHFRICVSNPATAVRVNGAPITVPLIGNFYYDLPITNQPLLIEADEPIMVAQVFPSQGNCGNTTGVGDPEVIYLSPVEQNINRVLWNATPNHNITGHYFNVIIPNKGTAISSFRLRNAAGAVIPTNPFVVHPQDPNYSYLRQQLPSAGVYSISSDSGFNAIAYGFGSFESYGYNAGTNVIDLFQFVTTNNQYATVRGALACKSSPFYLSLTLPYIPLAMKWEIPNYPDVVINAPVPDSSYVVSGRTIYEFRLTTPYIYNNVGTYPVKVTANNPTPDGCAGTQFINFDLQVFDQPKADFTFPAVAAAGCTDSTIQFTTANNLGGRPAIRHFWDFGDGTFAYTDNPTKVYLQPGEYKVRYSVITDVGCLSDTVEKVIRVTKTPQPAFTINDPQCIGKTVGFADASVLPGNYGTITNWNWNLGNGTTFNNTNANSVSTTYAATGTYNVSLELVTNTGCRYSISQPVQIHPRPVPDFTMSAACLPDGVVQFTNQSTIPDGTQNLLTYNWNFGNPASGALNSSTLPNPQHRYSSVGPFAIKLIATSNNGCVDSVTKTQTNIYPQPKAAIAAPAEVCWQTPVTFNSTATNGFTHPIVRWEWRFSDGTSSTQQNPVKNFTAPGTYTATLWAFTDQNCVSDTVQHTVVVHPWPTAANSLSSPLCETNELTITDNSAANVGSLVRWHWNFGDGTIVNQTAAAPVKHTYANWGDKTIRLVVENSKGCISDTLVKTVRVHPLPQPGFVLPEVCLSDAQAIFTDTTRIADGSSGFSYQWRFNAGIPAVTPGPTPATSTAQNPAVKYNKADNYVVSVKVTSAAGCVDSTAKNFTVNGSIPVANFAILPTNGLCSNRPAQIQNKSTVDFGSITRVEIYWDLDNNPTVFDVDEEPVFNKIYSHQYPNFQSPLTRNFRIRFRAFSGGTCVDDEIKTITINASPLTQFLPMPAICLDAVPRQITEASELGGLAGTGVFSGPGVSATGLFNPAVAGVGTHTLRYTFTANNGCTMFSEQTIEVWPRPVADFVSLLPSCEKNAVGFTDQSQHNAASLSTWIWNFGDGTAPVTITSGPAASHVFNSFNTYNVTLQVINDRGCTSIPVSKPVTVHPLPRVQFDLPQVCLPVGRAAFTDRSTIPDGTESQFRYLWKFGDPAAAPPGSDTSNLKNPVYHYRNLGAYNVRLIVTSSNNCVDSLDRLLTDVFPQPKAAFSAVDSLCLDQNVVFTDQSNGQGSTITQWRWQFGDGNSSATQNPMYRYRQQGAYTASLFVITDKGCVSDTATKRIEVWDYPVVNAGPDLTVLEDGIRQISDARATGSGLQFLWTPPTWLDNVRVQNPTIVRPQDDITYRLTVTGRGGCTAFDEVFVKILRMPKPPNTFTPNGDGFNDFWEIPNLNDYPGCIIEVYNTAGTLVYRSVGYATPWNGTYKGQPLPAGTYYYVIDPKNGRAPMKGYVTILR
ncbi:MAG: PKD domain-containing protein [Lacibacter sp.]